MSRFGGKPYITINQFVKTFLGTSFSELADDAIELLRNRFIVLCEDQVVVQIIENHIDSKTSNDNLEEKVAENIVSVLFFLLP